MNCNNVLFSVLADAHSPSSSLCKSGPIEVRADGKDQSTCILNVQIQTIKLNLPCMQPGIFLERLGLLQHYTLVDLTICSRVRLFIMLIMMIDDATTIIGS